MSRWHRLARDRRGGVAILAAAALGIATGAMALAVDLGALYQESRKLQGIADAAALAAAGQLSAVNEAAATAIAANRAQRPIATTIVTGTWRADATVAPPLRFVAGGGAPNAARVVLTEDAPLYFGGIVGLRSIRLARRATAVRTDLASFSVGSRLLALDGGIANRLLGALTGSNIALTVADYQALADADIDLLAFSDALRSELRLTGMSFTRTLGTRTTLPHVLNAVAAALGADGAANAAAAAGKLAASVGPTAFAAGQIVDLGPLGQQDRGGGGPSIMVNAYALIQAALTTAGGARQVSFALDTAATGLATATVRLAIGERMASSPWVAVTASGDPVVRTAQSRLAIDARVGAPAALQALGAASVRLPLAVELAEAQARLSSLTCGGGTRRATLSVLPSIGHVAIGDAAASTFADMSVPLAETAGVVVDIAGLKVTATAAIPFSGNDWQSVAFDAADLDARATKTVTAGASVAAIVAALTGKARVDVQNGPLGLPDSGIAALMKPVLDAAAPRLDAILASLLGLLGVQLGQADTRIDGVRCGTAALVE